MMKRRKVLLFWSWAASTWRRCRVQRFYCVDGILDRCWSISKPRVSRDWRYRIPLLTSKITDNALTLSKLVFAFGGNYMMKCKLCKERKEKAPPEAYIFRGRFCL
ncbi:hypothetical protein BDZ45DRAFT_86751 [Acephala macrosclerotiorum]|nr:hypothetical protein BDZ45DRAFT_86751 [Acephala macrosclerotiorum]